jgi:hypothetical protein
MAPDEKRTRAERLLNPEAAEDVREAQKSTISASPADPDVDELKFENELLRYASEWLATSGTEASKSRPFAFVISRSIDADIDLLKSAGVSDPTRYQAFHSQKMVTVPGCLIVTTVNLENALVLPVQKVTNAQHLLDEITKLGLSGRQVGVFEPPAANLILLRWGLDGKSRAQAVIPPGSLPPWKRTELEAEIAQFHADQTRVPDAALFPWRSPAKNGVTVEKLENRISKQLALYLDRVWKRGSVIAEYPSNAGRIDVFLNAHVLEQACGPCVIEVKVLRSRSSTREKKPEFSINWAKKGLIQADLYRQDTGALSTYLYSFDARDKDEDLPEVDALAGRLNIRHRRHFMYRSTDGLQRAELAKAEAG